MKTKHTKGEWSVRFKYVTDDAEGSIAIESNIEDRGWIAEAKGSHLNLNMSQEEFEANSKLIAASPELLEALIELLKQNKELIEHVIEQGHVDWEDESIEGVNDMNNAIEKAEKAIKKATS